MLESPLDNEISIVPFRYKYLSALLEILGSNDFIHIAQINMKTLPKIGYMAIRNGYPIAAGFLRRVEGGYAQLDTLCSAKHYGSQIRHEGIVKVLDSLLSEAKDLKLHGIIAFTDDSSIVARAEAMGFQVINQTIITLKL